MEKTFTKIFTDNSLSYLELRYSNSNKHYKKHFHDTFSIGINKEGRSIYTNENKDYFLDKDMISIINPMINHSCNSCSKVLNIFYMMYLNLDWCLSIQQLINLDIKRFIPVSDDILYDKCFYKKYIELAENIFSDIPSCDKDNEVINFMFDFFSLYIKKDKISINENKNKRIDEIIIYLNDNYKENISIKELALLFDINEFYLIRLFKINTNLTPVSYIINLRINYSKELIKKGYSILDTALECGFFDQIHFHRNFLKITAMTPNEYKVNFVQ